TVDPADVADAVVEAAGRTLGVDSSVLVETTAGPRATVRATWFGTEAALGETHPDPHADLHTIVVAEGGPLVIEDLGADGRIEVIGPHAPASTGASVVVGGPPGFHGSLSVLSVEQRAFTPDEM